MFNQSRFRWTPQDATSILLNYTRGRCDFTTPNHLRRLDRQLLGLLERKGQIQDAMSAPLRAARSALPRDRYVAGLDLIGMSPDEAIRIMVVPPARAVPTTDVARALRGIPLPNPLTQAWELRQVLLMYQAAADMIEDTLCDLVNELAPTLGLDRLAALTTDKVTSQLEWRVAQQRRARGESGDPRRAATQTYPALPQ